MLDLKPKKCIALLLALLLTALCLPLSASAAKEYNSLNKVQNYFRRTIGSLARADYYKTDILASITVAQAIFESGWAMYSLPVCGNNLFGIKAWSTTEGWIYDAYSKTVYSSYDDMRLANGQSYIGNVATWRAHASWGESVDAHSELLLNPRYKAVVGEKDPRKVAEALVAAGYCNDDGYADNVVRMISSYDLAEFDDIEPDTDGVVAITFDNERLFLDIGAQQRLLLNIFPETSAPTKVTWASADPGVATVSDDGTVNAVAHGMTLVTATLENGREACCIVAVDCNATVMNSDIIIRKSPSASGEKLGTLVRGLPIKVISDKILYDAAGSPFYSVRGISSDGKLTEGYATAECIKLNRVYANEISFVKDSVTLIPGQTYTPAAAIAPAGADATVAWTSSAPDIASADENGGITAHKAGSCIITAELKSGVKANITVTVASAENEYRGIIASYSNISVRGKDENGGFTKTVGSIPFLSEVAVIGEPDGLWYRVRGKTSAGKEIEGYVLSFYVQIIADGAAVETVTPASGVTVYAEKDTASLIYGELCNTYNSTAVYAKTIGGEDENGWSYVIGVRPNGNAVCGYAQLASVPTPDPDPDPDPDPSAESYYAVVAEPLNVRKGAGTGYESLGLFKEGERIIITGEEQNGWYRVSGITSDGKSVSGWSSAQYIKVLYTGVTKDALNVRKTAGTSGTLLGTFRSGVTITIYGEAVDGWMNVSGTVSTGASVTGWSSAEYITVTGRIKAETTTEKGFGLKEGVYEITGGKLIGVSAGTTVREMLLQFTGSVKVTSPNGSTLAEGTLVGTGTVITADNGDTATAVVMGDVSGDGKIDSTDYLYVKRAFLGTYDLSGDYLLAADVSGRRELSVVDYLIIKRVALGTYTL